MQTQLLSHLNITREFGTKLPDITFNPVQPGRVQLPCTTSWSAQIGPEFPEVRVHYLPLFLPYCTPYTPKNV